MQTSILRGANYAPQLNFLHKLYFFVMLEIAGFLLSNRLVHLALGIVLF